MYKLIYIMLGGALGALLRYMLSGFVYRVTNYYFFPSGTLFVNLLGALIIGFLFGAFQNITIPNNIRVFIFIGFLGAFTTFSTYSLETFNLLKDSEYKFAILNILLNNVFSILFVFIGFALAHILRRSL